VSERAEGAEGAERAERPECAEGAEGDAGTSHAWEQLWMWWVLLLAVAEVATGLGILLDPDLSAAKQAFGVGLLLALAVGYWRVGLPAMRRHENRRSAIYVCFAIAIETALLCLHPAAFSMLFGLYPQCYAGFRKTRWGMVSAMVLTLVVGIANFGWSGWRVAALPSVLIQTGLSAAFGVLFAVWITRIIRQSTQRAEIIAELERTRGELAEAHRLVGVRAERERLVVEIHDTLAQGFTSIVLLAQAARGDASRREEYLRSIEETARDNLAEARALVSDLGPAGLQRAVLVDAIHRIAERFGAETGVAIECRVRGEVRHLPAEHEVTLLRATQEAFANIRKHAAAARATLELEFGPEVRLTVSDDGRGFDPLVAQGFGLAGLRRRVAQVGGTAQVISAVGKGSRVEVELP
jgi:signal transduction histidine kinase